MSEVTRGEFEGLGGRVNKIQVEVAEEKVKTKRNEQDIQKVYDGIEDLTETGAATYQQIRTENAKNNRDLLVRVVFVFIGGIAIMILKDLIMKGA